MRFFHPIKLFWQNVHRVKKTLFSLFKLNNFSERFLLGLQNPELLFVKLYLPLRKNKRSKGQKSPKNLANQRFFEKKQMGSVNLKYAGRENRKASKKGSFFL